MRPKIVCVLQKSNEYDADYVAHLFAGVSAHLREFEFSILHGSEWPGWWSKMELFRPDVKGDLLYFDLDTIIVGPIDDLFIGKLTMLSDFNVPDRLASGVMFLPEDEREKVWEEWIRDPEFHMRSHPEGDGGFLSRFYKNASRWQNELPGQIVSYKNHCKNGVPAGARVVAFHGQPRPRALDWKI